MKTRILLIIAIQLMFCTVNRAQSIDSLWLEMPDSLASYLSQDVRKEMLDIAVMGVKSPTSNNLDGESMIDSISTDYISVKMSAVKQLEMLKTVTPDGDSCLVVLSTFQGDELSDTEINRYDLDWNPLGKIDLSSDEDIHRLFEDALQQTETKPDDEIFLQTCSAHITSRDTIEATFHFFPAKEDRGKVIKNIKIDGLKFK